MAVYKISELRNLSEKELGKKLDELDLALLEEGEGNPKKNREIRKAIARIKTIQNEGAGTGGSARFGNSKNSQSIKKA